ncbi:hypothetical protein IMG5_187570 [Ichthyophthirius multifiliis]|uniref:Actin n=1 Tax=Ichthyophthirius multifiliis TaxID=5932 RepID=G0R3U5_ICHMU|nr:hypothetical protein IMG5_187570 [Ichthyophthirius multifiliis]EGR27852.1 hypothetical protein IMG5_187570 [Ichthyophthirius multifiliis]|eukprot:XP_004027197.1 hypothetical protein IMG5_187570 [Ichthyophthirius multifiliis]
MDNFGEFLTKNPIVIDNGSGTMRAGLAGNDKPKLQFDNYVGRPKYKMVIPTKSQPDQYLGNITDEQRGMLKLQYPINHGCIQNWDDMDLIWKYCYCELQVSQKEHNYFFENYNTPALFIAVQGVLSLFASGKTTGIIIEIGDGVTQIVPVFEGYSLQYAQQRIDLGGRNITEYFNYLLRRSGYYFHTSAEFEIIKKIKEKKCFVSLVNQGDDKNYDTRGIVDTVTLPDGNTMTLTFEKQKAAEILFNPSLIGLEYTSISDLLIRSVQKVDIDLRNTLYQEIIISGGCTKLKDFPNRFLNEVKKIVPKQQKVKAYSPENREDLCWIGGSILSNLASFKNMWITKKDYEEQGERVLLKNSF